MNKISVAYLKKFFFSFMFIVEIVKMDLQSPITNK